MACNCKLCQRDAEVSAALLRLHETERAFWESMYGTLLNTEFDLEHAQAVIDGSWPDADGVIAATRNAHKEAA